MQNVFLGQNVLRGDVRKNTCFAHDMTNFQLDVRGKRFNTHVTGKIPVPPPDPKCLSYLPKISVPRKTEISDPKLDQRWKR